ncbi:hypothetical protein PMAYCL1PPCAC_05334, partial [Pristionchus mayeri]
SVTTMCLTPIAAVEDIAPLLNSFSLLRFPPEILTEIMVQLNPVDRTHLALAHDSLMEVDLKAGHRIFSKVCIDGDSQIEAFDDAARYYRLNLNDIDVTPATLRAFFKHSSARELSINGTVNEKVEYKLEAALRTLQFGNLLVFLNDSAVRILSSLSKSRASFGKVDIWWQKDLKELEQAREMLLSLPAMEKFLIHGMADQAVVDDEIVLSIVRKTSNSADFRNCNKDAVTAKGLVEVYQMVANSSSSINEVHCDASTTKERQFLYLLAFTLKQSGADRATIAKAVERTNYEYGAIHMHSTRKIRDSN